jgi:hypothetical protein
MSQLQNASVTEQEGRIELALKAYHTHQFRSLHRAADAFNIPPSTLTNRFNGKLPRPTKRANGHNLTTTEEQTIVQYILDLDSRGVSPRLCEVEDMANKLLEARGQEKVGKNWPSRFIARLNELKMAFNRAKDR